MKGSNLDRFLSRLNCSFLRQVSGINYLIEMSTYRSACRDNEVTWVG